MAAPSPIRRKLLVLDLKGTILVCSPPTDDGTRRACYPRPYMSSFRRYLFHPSTRSWLDVMIWSSVKPRNAQDFVRACFKEDTDKIAHLWARDTMGLNKEQYNKKSDTVKDLAKIWDSSPSQQLSGFSRNNTILVDDSTKKARLQPTNHICVEVYDFKVRDEVLKGGDDKTLVGIVGILDALQKEEDVTAWIPLRLTCPTGSIPPYGKARPHTEWFHDMSTFQFWVKRGEKVLEDMHVGCIKVDGDTEIV